MYVYRHAVWATDSGRLASDALAGDARKERGELAYSSLSLSRSRGDIFLDFFFSYLREEGDGHHHHRVAVEPAPRENGEAHGSKNKVHQRIKVSTGTREKKREKQANSSFFYTLSPSCHRDQHTERERKR